MAIRIYHHLDAGAPTPTASSNPATLAKFTNLANVLKACLVNGFGSNVAAGWTLVAEGPLFLVLRPASGAGYVTFSCEYAFSAVATNYNGMRVYLSATYTGMLNGVPQGAGVVTGQAAGNTTPHYYHYTNIWATTTQLGWVMVADENTFNLQLTGTFYLGTGYYDAHLDTDANCGATFIHCGLDSAGNLIAAGGSNTAPSAGANTQYSYFKDIEFTTLRNPSTGLLVDTGGINARVQALRLASAVYYSTVFSQGELELSRVRWQANGAAAGYLRGVAIEPSMISGYAYQFKNLITGLTGSVSQAGVVSKTLSLDGYFYNPVVASRGSAASALALFTSNPALW